MLLLCVCAGLMVPACRSAPACPLARPSPPPPAPFRPPATSLDALREAGLEVQACSTSGPSARYLLVVTRPGQRDPTGTKHLLTVHDAAVDAFGETVPDYIGDIAPGPADCRGATVGTIRISIREDAPFDDIVRTIVQFADDRLPRALILRYAFDFAPIPELRCEPDDPACGPIVHGDEGTCAERHGYRRDALRKPVHPAGKEARMTCAHDGECRVGCENRCESVSRASAMRMCTSAPGAAPKGDPTFCGCVEGRCRWFRQ